MRLIKVQDGLIESIYFAHIYTSEGKGIVCVFTEREKYFVAAAEEEAFLIQVPMNDLSKRG